MSLLFGELMIWLATAAAVVATGVYASAINNPVRNKLARVSFLSVGAFCSGAIGFLWTLILQQRYDVTYVNEFTSRDLPLIYRISALWNGQQGTFLLWVFFSVILGILVMRFARNYEAPTLTFLSAIQLGMLWPVVMEDPFQLIRPAPDDGQGMNLLLQSRWMVAHPPLMFLGYATMGLPFCLAMSALLRNDPHGWVKYALPFSGLALAMHGAGIVLGGLWSYNVLGWGGYWMWDPVENASIIPWFACAALVHGLLLQRARRSMVRFNLFMALLTFLLTYYCTFVTRSGLIQSVHSFGFSKITYWLLGIMVTYTLASFILFAIRIRGVRSEKEAFTDFRSFHFWLYYGSIAFAACTVIVWAGLSAPFGAGILNKLMLLKHQVGNLEAAFYNKAMAPVTAGMLVLLSIAPFYLVKKNPFRDGLFKCVPLWVCVNLAVLAMIIAFLLHRTWFPPVSPQDGRVALWWILMLVGLAAMALSANFYAFLNRWRKSPLHTSGFVSHIGLALFLLGVVSSDMHTRSRGMDVSLNKSKNVFDYTVSFRGVHFREGDKKHEVRLEVSRKGRRFSARPIMWTRSYAVTDTGEPMIVREPYVKKFLTHDLYLEPVWYYPDGTTLVLKKGQTEKVGNWRVRFVRFVIPEAKQDGEFHQHGRAHHQAENLKIGVLLEFSRDGKTNQVVVEAQSVENRMVPEPVEVKAGGRTVRVSLESIRAEERQIGLRVEGLGLPVVVDLQKGGSARVGEWSVRFVGFEPISAEAHQAMMEGRSFKVVANVEVAHKASKFQVKPAIRVPGQTGELESTPVKVPGTNIKACLHGLSVSEGDGKVVVQLEGLGHFINLNVQIKPGINLVRLGVLLILLGTLMATVHRFKEIRRQKGEKHL